MIYILDDEIDTVTAISSAFSFANIDTCREVTSWQACYKEMQISPPSLLILDLIMPYTDGEDVLEKVLSKWPGTKVIVTTGDRDIQRAVRCIKKGAVEYLTKPLNLEELCELVKHYSPHEQTTPTAHSQSTSERMTTLLTWRKTLFAQNTTASDTLLLHALEGWIEGEGWKERGLTLSTLAKKLNSNTTYLSRCINRTWQLNFATWLNRLRLISFIENYAQNEVNSIEGIADNSGFHSKSQLYTTTAKEIGIPPTQIRELWNNIATDE